jgi:hypothetical protein
MVSSVLDEVPGIKSNTKGNGSIPPNVVVAALTRKGVMIPGSIVKDFAGPVDCRD